MSEATNGHESGHESGCKICQDSTSNLLSCCGNPLCSNCFRLINQQSDGETKSPSCPLCRQPIGQLCPIVPLSKEQIRAMKRAEIAAQVALARQKEEAIMDALLHKIAEIANLYNKKHNIIYKLFFIKRA